MATLKRLLNQIRGNKRDLYFASIVFFIIPAIIAAFPILPPSVFIGLILSFLAQAIILTLYIRNS